MGDKIVHCPRVPSIIYGAKKEIECQKCSDFDKRVTYTWAYAKIPEEFIICCGVFVPIMAY